MYISSNNWKEHKSSIGNKARVLFELIEQGFTVPSLFVWLPSSSEHYNKKDFHHIFHQELDEIITTIDATKLYAIRSSFGAEDSAGQSYAGIFESYINVSNEQIIDKIYEVYKSRHDTRYTTYILNQSLESQGGHIAIIIQEMVHPTLSGIAFTRNPNGNLNDMVLSLAKGYCDAIVDGKATTTEYYMDRKNNDIFQDSRIDNKEKELLPLQQIKDIAVQLLRIENHYGCAQDIEFSIDENDALIILQARPITTIDSSKFKIIDNTNIVESYPNITLPLTFSFASRAYQQVFRQVLSYIPLSNDENLHLEKITPHLLFHFNGRVYYTLHHWLALINVVFPSKAAHDSWKSAVGLNMDTTTQQRSQWMKKVKVAWTMIKLIFRQRTLNEQFFREFDATYESILKDNNHLDQYGNNTSLILQKLLESNEKILVNYPVTLINDAILFRLFGILQQWKVKLGFEENDTIINDLLMGIKGIETEEAVISLLELKDYITQDEKLKSLYQKDNQTIENTIQSNEKYATLKVKIDEYIRLYGDRTKDELKLEQPSYSIDRISIHELIKSQLDYHHSVASFRAKQTEVRTQATKILKEQKKYRGVRKLVFDWLLKQTKKAVRNRENMRLRRVRAYGAVKTTIHHIANILCKEGMIEDTRDIYYLHLEELMELPHITTLRQLINDRKATYLTYQSLQPPDRIIYEDTPKMSINNCAVRTLNSKELTGLPISKGVVNGKALVLHTSDYAQSIKGRILVTRYTDPSWLFLMTQSSGIITENGSPLSHTAIVGRELGIPVITKVEGATHIIHNGQSIILNADLGIITLD